MDRLDWHWDLQCEDSYQGDVAFDLRDILEEDDGLEPDVPPLPAVA